MQLAITTTQSEENYLIQVSGEVDVSCADELREAMDAALESGSMQIEVDLSEVSYIDSTGIGVLVGAAHRAREAEHNFKLSHPQRNVARVLALLGVSEELGLVEEGA